MTLIRFLGVALLTMPFISAVDAQELSFHCPTEGLFTGPPQIVGDTGDTPNPSAGWDFFFNEGTLQKVEISSPPMRNGYWLVTCDIEVKGASISINTSIPGTRACQFSSNGGSVMSQSDGSEVCQVNNADTRDRCSIICR
jgi:hypothetical protein